MNKWLKGIVLGVLIASIFTIPGKGFAAETDDNSPKFKSSFGTFRLFESMKFNEAGEIVGGKGMNVALGYSARQYFKPLEKNSWNGFVHWGTVFVIFPFVGIGAEYLTENVYFEIGTFYLFPYASIGFHI